MLLAAIHDNTLLVVQRLELLAADGEVGIVDVAQDGHGLSYAALLVDNVCQGVGGTAVFQHHRVEGVALSRRKYLDVGGIAVGEHLVHLAAFVPALILHGRSAQHLVTVFIHLHHIHAGRPDVVAIGLLELDV